MAKSSKKTTPDGVALEFDPENPAPDHRILEFHMGGEKYRIQISDKQRFTFGSLNGGRYNGNLALRIYEGANKDNQLAVFVDVTDVRDISVPVIKIRKPRGLSEWSKADKLQQDMAYAAFDVLSSYATTNQPQLKENIDKLAQIVTPLLGPAETPPEDDDVPFAPVGYYAAPAKVSIP